MDQRAVVSQLRRAAAKYSDLKGSRDAFKDLATFDELLYRTKAFSLNRIIADGIFTRIESSPQRFTPLVSSEHCLKLTSCFLITDLCGTILKLGVF